MMEGVGRCKEAPRSRGRFVGTECGELGIAVCQCVCMKRLIPKVHFYPTYDQLDFASPAFDEKARPLLGKPISLLQVHCKPTLSLKFPLTTLLSVVVASCRALSFLCSLAQCLSSSGISHRFTFASCGWNVSSAKAGVFVRPVTPR